MIPISSQSPTLPSHNSLNYELLSLTAICGEVPCGYSARLTASESYRKKVVTSLTHDKLLRIFSRHHLRGYRLGIRGKRLLLQQEPERFEFYLSGCNDTNAIKSEVSRRVRLHRIAQTYVTMLNAGALIYRDEKPPIFSPTASGPFCIEHPCFYDSREMKEAELEMLKIRGSRMAGALFTSGRIFAVYNSMEFLPVFEPQVEMRAKVKERDRDKVRVREKEGQPTRSPFGTYQNVFLSDSELVELQNELPTSWQHYIDRLSEYMASSGRQYQNHAATIRRWAAADQKKSHQQPHSRDYSVEEGETV